MRFEISFEGTEAEFSRWLSTIALRPGVEVPAEPATPAPVPVAVPAETVKASPVTPAPETLGAAAPAWWVAQGNEPPAPQRVASVQEALDRLPKVDPAKREAALVRFGDFLVAWLDGWEVEGVPQPDRAKLMEEMGLSSYATTIVILGYELLSLQKLVLVTLERKGIRLDNDKADRLAANLVQIGGLCGFPELCGTYDYSNAWRK